MYRFTCGMWFNGSYRLLKIEYKNAIVIEYKSHLYGTVWSIGPWGGKKGSDRCSGAVCLIVSALQMYAYCSHRKVSWPHARGAQKNHGHTQFILTSPQMVARGAQKARRSNAGVA